MDMEAAIGYLVALAVPLWFVVEFVIHKWTSSTQPVRQVQPGSLAERPAARTPSTAPRPRTTALAQPRRAT